MNDFQELDQQLAHAYREWVIFLVLQKRELELVTSDHLPTEDKPPDRPAVQFRPLRSKP